LPSRVRIGREVSAAALTPISDSLALLPTKGIPLPMVSYGGSSLLMSLLVSAVTGLWWTPAAWAGTTTSKAMRWLVSAWELLP